MSRPHAAYLDRTAVGHHVHCYCPLPLGSVRVRPHQLLYLSLHLAVSVRSHSDRQCSYCPPSWNRSATRSSSCTLSPLPTVKYLLFLQEHHHLHGCRPLLSSSNPTAFPSPLSSALTPSQTSYTQPATGISQRLCQLSQATTTALRASAVTSWHAAASQQHRSAVRDGGRSLPAQISK